MSDSFDERVFSGNTLDNLARDIAENEINFSHGDYSSDLSHGSKVVTARGTEDGLVLRIDGRAAWSEVLADIDSFLGSRRRFLDGGEVSVEWLERLPTREQSKELEEYLQRNYSISVFTRRRRNPKISLAKNIKQTVIGEVVEMNEVGSKDIDNQNSNAKNESFISLADLSDGISANKGDVTKLSEKEGTTVVPSFSETAALGISDGPLDSSSHRKYLSCMSRILGDDVCYEEDANAKIVFGTLRSGQRLETPFSLIIVGDVNPGADIIAGGDIIVIGSLRGTAQASAYDDEGFDRVIIALGMQPMQLRIGSIISRGSDELAKGMEIARVDNRRIIVEPFNSRSVMPKKLR